MFPEDEEFDFDHSGRLDGFEFGLKQDEEEREIRDAREHPTTYRAPNRIPTWLIVITYVLTMLSVNLFVDAVNGIVKSSTYNQAKRLVWQEEYEKALHRFFDVKEMDFRDTKSYEKLCWAHMNFDKGDVLGAYNSLESVHFSKLTKKQERSLQAFRDEVEEAYRAYEAEREKRNEQPNGGRDGESRLSRMKTKFDLQRSFWNNDMYDRVLQTDAYSANKEVFKFHAERKECIIPSPCRCAE